MRGVNFQGVDSQLVGTASGPDERLTHPIEASFGQRDWRYIAAAMRQRGRRAGGPPSFGSRQLRTPLPG